MEIGQRIKITLGQAVTAEFKAHGIYERVISQPTGYFFLGRTGTVVAYDDRLHMYGVALDGDVREDGSPDVRWFEEDDKSQQGQVIVPLTESVSVDEATAVYQQYADANTGRIQAHNEAIRAEIRPLQDRLAVLKKNAPTLESPRDEYDAYRRAGDDLRYQIYCLERQLMKS